MRIRRIEMDVASFGNITTFTVLFTFIGVLVIGAFKAYERITNPGSPETWDRAKFGLFVVVVGVIMLLEYLSSGVMSFPTDDIIQIGITMTTPIFGLFGLAYSTIVAGKLIKRDVIVPIVASVKAEAASKPTGTPLPASETNWLAISVTPTYQAGKGIVPVKFNIYGTQPQPDHPGISSIDIDFADGSAIQTVVLKGDQATADHIFTFVKTQEYTGHTFYPIFKCNGSDGSTYLFNAGDRKSVEIYVESL